MKEVLDLGPFSSRESLESAVRFWDASSAHVVGECPRKAEYLLERGLRPRGEPYAYLRAGSAIHAALNAFHAGAGTDEIMAAAAAKWGEDIPAPPGSDYAHLSLGFIEGVVKNYILFYEKHKGFHPLIVRPEEINRENLVAAVWNVTDDERIVLGESKIVMRFDVDGEELIYAGKPDLPALMGGQVICVDFKSTSSYLSTWYFSQYRYSNQLRGYGAILSSLLSKDVQGAVIVGIHVGPKALESSSNVTRFLFYGPQSYSAAQRLEALKNQLHWKKVLDWHRENGYFPQHPGRACSSCDYAPLCAISPGPVRELATKQDYVQERYSFLDI